MGIFKKTIELAVTGVSRYKAMQEQLEARRQLEEAEQQYTIDHLPENYDPILIEKPRPGQTRVAVFYDINVATIDLVRSLRADGAGEFADVLKMLIPIMDWAHFDNQINDFGYKYFCYAATGVSAGLVEKKRLWSYVWLDNFSWDMPATKPRIGKARYFLALVHEAEVEVTSTDELEFWSSRERLPSRINTYLYKRRLLGNALIKLVRLEYRLLHEYRMTEYRDVLSSSQVASLISSLSIDCVDVNLVANVANKFNDPVLRKDLIEADSFSTQFLTDLIVCLDAVTGVLDSVVKIAVKQRKINGEHEHDMERAKTIDYLNDNIKPLDVYRDGFKIENIGNSSSKETGSDD